MTTENLTRADVMDRMNWKASSNRPVTIGCVMNIAHGNYVFMYRCEIEQSPNKEFHRAVVVMRYASSPSISENILVDRNYTSMEEAVDAVAQGILEDFNSSAQPWDSAVAGLCSDVTAYTKAQRGEGGAAI